MRSNILSDFRSAEVIAPSRRKQCWQTRSYAALM
jgi:hypothetical protein